MRVSEGNLTGQYYCDYLNIIANELINGNITKERRHEIHQEMVLQNLFLHRISVDGGFHARVLRTLLLSENDKHLLIDLLKSGNATDNDTISLNEWLKKAYEASIKDGNPSRKLAVSAHLRSYISGTNQAAEIFAGFGSSSPESWWQLETRKLIITEVKNPELYLGAGLRPVWNELPLNRYAAYLAEVPDASSEYIYDAVVCIAGVWFSTLDRDEMIVWLNMPEVSVDEWDRFSAPLLTLDSPNPALETADWLYNSGNFDAAASLYANIALAYPKTHAEISAFEMLGEIFTQLFEYDNAFEAYKNAFMASKDMPKLQIALGLSNLAFAGANLGEDMSEYYERIALLAENLSASDRQILYFELSRIARKLFLYNDEYRYLEKIISENDGDETILQAAFSRLADLNRYVTLDGVSNSLSLKRADEESRKSEAVRKGDEAYFGFDPTAALFWYSRAGDSDEILRRRFSASLLSESFELQKKFSKTYVDEAVLRIREGYPPSYAAEYLNKAIDQAFENGEDPLSVIRPVFIQLSSDEIMQISSEITNRSTKDDEKSLIHLSSARCCMELGFYENARTFLRSALRANPGREVRSRIFADLGWVEYETGAYQASIDANNSALKINENFPAAFAGVAKSYAALHKYEEALTAAEKAVLLNPTNISYQNLKFSLTEVLKKPISEKPDLKFILGKGGTLQESAALYSELSGNYTSDAWNSMSPNDVVTYRDSV